MVVLLHQVVVLVSLSVHCGRAALLLTLELVVLPELVVVLAVNDQVASGSLLL